MHPNATEAANDVLTTHYLKQLATGINSAHRAAEGAIRSATDHAAKAGELLAEAKDRVPHGEWEAWVAANTEISARTARVYMQIARRLPEMDEANRQRVADLSLRTALAEIAEPAPVMSADTESVAGPAPRQVTVQYSVEDFPQQKPVVIRRHKPETIDAAVTPSGEAKVLPLNAWPTFEQHEYIHAVDCLLTASQRVPAETAARIIPETSEEIEELTAWLAEIAVLKARE